MNGCPVSAYGIDECTGAVIIDQARCIGCLYCTWNCPYDAPKFDITSGIIEKCHYCYHLISSGEIPACSSGCPTGALSFGEIPEKISFEKIGMLPEKRINPSYLLTGSFPGKGPEIVPPIAENDFRKVAVNVKSKPPLDSSLVVFTFLSTISVASVITAILSGKVIGQLAALITIIIAVISSLFHLRSKLKAWRAVINVLHSPLSREIVAMIVFGILILWRQFTDSGIVNIAVTLTGLIFLLLIDNVYHYTLGKVSRVNSGDVFITALLMISFFTLKTLPFLFIAVLKFAITLFSGKMTVISRSMFEVRFLRIAALFISAMVLISGIGAGTIPALIVFLTGELLDRILFYYDFEPLSIINTINKPFNISSDEKKNY